MFGWSITSAIQMSQTMMILNHLLQHILLAIDYARTIRYALISDEK